MAYTITDKCIACGVCVENCPVQAIKMEGDKAVIDKDVCISCGLCKSVCPVDAPEEE